MFHSWAEKAAFISCILDDEELFAEERKKAEKRRAEEIEQGEQKQRQKNGGMAKAKAG